MMCSVSKAAIDMLTRNVGRELAFQVGAGSVVVLARCTYLSPGTTCFDSNRTFVCHAQSLT